MTLTSASRVWNRAAVEAGGANARAGDLALANVLALHGVAMNGGVHRALEVLTLVQVEAAASGFNYFELPQVARLLWRLRSDPVVREWNASGEVEANRLYSLAIPNDQYLKQHFERKYLEQPQDFAPLGVESGADY